MPRGKARPGHSPVQVFKPWIVRRPDGGCQVLFPLTELDRLVNDALTAWTVAYLQEYLRGASKGEDMNLNRLAKDITLKEGGRVSLSIAQVKEVMRLLLRELAAMHPIDAMKVIGRYRAKVRK